VGTPRRRSFVASPSGSRLGISSCCPAMMRCSWPRSSCGATEWPSGSSRCPRRRRTPRSFGWLAFGPAARRSSCSTASTTVTLSPRSGSSRTGRVLPEYTGLPAEAMANLRIVPFNDLDAVEWALAPGDVALVLTEPAMTNAGFLLPETGFHDGLRQMTRRHNTLLGIDETHTLVTAYGGLTTEWGLEPDILTIGKSIAGGVPLGAYGMTDDVAAVLHPHTDKAVVSGIAYDEVATGGTLFANPLSMAAARAALTEVLTPEAFIATARLGENLAAGLRAHIVQAGLPWSVTHHGSHAYYFFSPQPPRDARGARDTDDPDLRALIRVFLANRGVWESGWWLGPTVSVAHSPADVDAYLDTIREFTEAVA
jgi:glutamate-1-semialdehyde 2,1-aminomutase